MVLFLRRSCQPLQFDMPTKWLYTSVATNPSISGGTRHLPTGRCGSVNWTELEVCRWSTETSLSVGCDAEDRFTGLRSPDLSICDYWLWGDLKRRVYAQQSGNLSELQDRVRQEVANISAKTRLKALMDFPRRLRDCADKAGAHIE